MRKYTEKALANVLDHAIINRMPEGMFSVDIDGERYFVLTDSYRIVRHFEDVPGIPHTEKSVDVSRYFRKPEQDAEMILPDRKTLKEWIKAQHIRRNNPGKVTFDIDGVHFNPYFLLDMIEGLPGCKAYKPNKRYSPVYFKAETGDGLLCPVMVPEY